MSDMRFNSSRLGSVAGTSSRSMDQGLRTYMLGVYNYMTLSLGITGLTALATNMVTVTQDEAGMHLTSAGYALYHSPLMWIVMLAPLGILFAMNARVSVGTLRTLFFVFSALMGVSMSVVLLRYTGQSVTRIFFLTSASFGALSLFGYTTRKDLSAMGSFMIMGLFGIIIASLVNLFMQSTQMQFILSILTVLVFSGLTAWDTQSIKQMYWAGDDSDTVTRKSIHGAVRLYLDFLNMFQALLAIFGDRR
eukprot:gene10122-10189_t